MYLLSMFTSIRSKLLTTITRRGPTSSATLCSHCYMWRKYREDQKHEMFPRYYWSLSDLQQKHICKYCCEELVSFNQTLAKETTLVTVELCNTQHAQEKK